MRLDVLFELQRTSDSVKFTYTNPSQGSDISQVTGTIKMFDDALIWVERSGEDGVAVPLAGLVEITLLAQ